MKYYEKHNNYTITTLMRMNKQNLADYCVLMQKNLVNMKITIDLQAKNSKKIIDELEDKIYKLERLGY